MINDNAKFFQVGDKYYTLDNPGGGQRPFLSETNLTDLRGRMGDKSTGFDFNATLQGLKSEGALQEFSNINDLMTQAGEKGYRVPSVIPQSTEFSNYLKGTGQTFDPTQGFSGTPGQLNNNAPTLATIQNQANKYVDPNAAGTPAQSPQQAVNYTTPQSTNLQNSVYKTWNGSNWDVFNANGTPMDQATFQSNKLNINHINTKEVLNKYQPKAGTPTGGTVVSAESLGGSGSNLGSMTNNATNNLITAQKNSETDTILTKLQGVLDTITQKEGALDTITQKASKLANLKAPSAEEQTAQKNLDELNASYRAGVTNTLGEVIPMAAITGELQNLDNQYKDKLSIAQNNLVRLQGNRQAQIDVAKGLLDVAQNEFTNVFTLVKAMAPENIGTVTNPQTGEVTVLMRNPITGETSSKNMGNIGGTKALDTSTVEVGGRKLLIDNQTGKTIKDLGRATGTNNTQDVVATLRSEMAQTKNLDGSPVIGNDGKLRAEVYNSFKQKWVNGGRTPASFDSQFADLRNPADSGYNVTGASSSSSNNNSIDFNSL